MVNYGFLKKTWFLSLLVPLTAFIIYFLTAADGPFPGASSSFLATVFYRHYSELCNSYPFMTVYTAWLGWLDPANAVTLLTVTAAAIMALCCLGVFHLTATLIRIFCVDMTNLGLLSDPRVLYDNELVARIGGFLSSVAFMLSIPVWSLGTRAYPQLIVIFLTVMMLTCFVEFRWRSLLRRIEDEPLNFRCYALFLSALLIGGMLAAISVESLILILFGVLFAGVVFIGEIRESVRLRGIPCFGVLAFLAGVALSFGALVLMNHLFHGPEQGLGARWAISDLLQQHLQTLFSFSTNVVSITGAVLVLVLCALFYGVFPAVYFAPTRILLGQVCIVLFFILPLVEQPAFFWQDGARSNGGLLHAQVTLLSIVVFASLVSAWFKAWQDSSFCVGRKLSHRLVGGVAAGFVLVLATGLFFINGEKARGDSKQANAFFTGLRKIYIDSGAAEKPYWLEPSAVWHPILVDNFTRGHRVIPLYMREKIKPSFWLDGQSFDEIMKGDAALSAAYQMTPPVFWNRLLDTPEYARFFLLVDPSGIPFPSRMLWPLGPFYSCVETELSLDERASLLDKTFQTFSSEIAGPYADPSLLALKNALRRGLAVSANWMGVALFRFGESTAEKERGLVFFNTGHELDPENISLLLNRSALALTVLKRSIPLDEETVARLDNIQPKLESLRGIRELVGQFGPLYTPALMRRISVLLASAGSEYTAITAFELAAALDTSTDTPQTQLARAQLFFNMNDWEQARYWALQAAEELSDDPDVRNLLIDLCVRRPLLPDVDAMLEKGDPEQKHPVAETIRVLRRNPGTPETVSKLKDAVYKDYRNPRTALLYLHALLESGDLKQAENMALHTMPKNFEREHADWCLAAQRMLVEAIQSGDPERAYGICRAALIKNPLQPRLWTIRLRSGKHIHQSDTVLEREVRECLALYPRHPEACRLMAELFRSSGRTAEADALEQAIRK